MWIIEEQGVIDYAEAYKYQEKLVSLKQEGEKNNYLLLLQHPPVFTRGRNAKENNILDKNIPVYTINRGGDVTYHEPGQLTGYIILDLRREKLNIRAFITKIEDLIINSLQKFGLPAERTRNSAGVWVNNKKIASIGITIRKGITMHGFALNVNNSLEGFKKINPCGLDSGTMTSLQEQLGYPVSIEEFQRIFINEVTRKGEKVKSSE